MVRTFDLFALNDKHVIGWLKWQWTQYAIFVMQADNQNMKVFDPQQAKFILDVDMMNTFTDHRQKINSTWMMYDFEMLNDFQIDFFQQVIYLQKLNTGDRVYFLYDNVPMMDDRKEKKMIQTLERLLSVDHKG